jgi:hypothetical protein
MSGRRNHFRSCRVRNVLPLVQTPVRARSSITTLRDRVANQNRNIRGRFVRTLRSRNSFVPSTPAPSPNLSPINPVRLILRFNRVSLYSPISSIPISPGINPITNIINTPPHRAISDLELFGLQNEDPVIDNIRIPVLNLDRVSEYLNTNLFESEYAYNPIRLNDSDLDNFNDLSL